MTASAIVVAGHCCLDIIPSFAPGADGTLRPGKLVDVGPALLAPGGSVSNVGLALHRLGTPVRLLGKVGDDQFGQALLALYEAHDPTLAQGMIVAPGGPTSYSVVISPPGSDRIFLHCPGANHTFSATDIADEQLDGARIFSFGYPPLMRRMYQDGGEELAAILQLAQSRGLLTALDMALPDPASEAGQVDWRPLLQRVLPYVDCFLPSIEEILFMLDRAEYEALRAHYGLERFSEGIDGALLGSIADQLLDWGSPVVALKLGDQGLYLRTATTVSRLALLDETLPAAWANRELLVPCFQVDVAGTTGSGDTTIAGFLTALLHGMTPEATLRCAVAVGAYSVEQVDATSGIPVWQAVQDRIAATWLSAPLQIALPNWRQDDDNVWHSQRDKA